MSRHAFPMIDVPELPAKPRLTGITSVLDKGLGPGRLADLLSVSHPWIDVVKLGWATARLQPETIVREKLAILAAHQVRACTGGTFLEVALAQGRADAFLDEAVRLGFPMVEVSNGVHPMTEDEKLGLIDRARARGLTVWSEVGKKEHEADARLGLAERVSALRAELDAGAERVILEARESGTVGIFDEAGEPIEELVARITEAVGRAAVVFEAPRKSQQVWLIRRLGNQVNLGNIAPDDALSLATLRTGLRGDTFRDFQMPGVKVFLELGVSGAVAARGRGGVVVLIDALRASATIVTALQMGMRSVRAVASVEECRGDVTAGERGGRKIPTLDHGNSPTELLARGEAYAGRSLVLTTTNGTECLLEAAGEDALVLIGTTLNAGSVGRRALALAEARDCPVTLLMAGRNNQACLEDELAASEILAAMGPTARLQAPVPRASRGLEADFFRGASGANLVRLGYAEDVRYCAQLDTHQVVPVFRDGRLVPWEDP